MTPPRGRSSAGAAIPRISVLLPFRDAAPTLAEAVDSVLAQGGPELELLAIDDGSHDEGPALVSERARLDPRLRLLEAGGVGIARALELGRAMARAPLLGRMDADDVSLPGRFAAQVAMLEADPSLAAIGTRVEAFPAAALGDGLRRYVAWQNALATPAEHRRDLFVESPLCHPSVLMRADAVADVGGYRAGDFAEDYDLFLRLVAAGHGLAKVPRTLLRWRHREGRATFSDPRMAPERIRALKALHLAPLLRAEPRRLVIWGAGRTGRRLARALEAHGAHAAGFIDIDPDKIGRRARGALIEPPESLDPSRDHLVVAVGAQGARALIRAALERAGFREGEDYLCAA